MNLPIPNFMHVQSRVLKEILELSENEPNDTDLGKSVRRILKNYKDGEYNPPSDIEFDMKIHPDTYDKPYFAIVEPDVPTTPILEQLYREDGSKHQIDGEDVRLAMRTEEAIDISGLRTPPNVMQFMIGNYAHDSISWSELEEEEMKELLMMCKSYKDKIKNE